MIPAIITGFSGGKPEVPVRPALDAPHHAGLDWVEQAEAGGKRARSPRLGGGGDAAADAQHREAAHREL